MPHAPSIRNKDRRYESSEFPRSVTRVNLCVVHARTSDATGAAIPCMGRCDWPPTTALRVGAPTQFWQRFRSAYGHRHSRSGHRVRTSCTTSLEPVTDRPHDPRLPFTVTFTTSRMGRSSTMRIVGRRSWQIHLQWSACQCLLEFPTAPSPHQATRIEPVHVLPLRS